MNRRGFFKAIIASTATVAIGMRMAHGMPHISAWRLEKFGPYTYGIDLNDPIQVHVHLGENEIPVSIRHVNEMARYQHERITKFDPLSDIGLVRTDYLELASRIKMSQGMAQYNIDGTGSVLLYADNGMHDGTIPLPQVYGVDARPNDR